MLYKPSARNSGLDKIWYFTSGFLLAERILAMLSAARTGTVLFSTTILSDVATSAIMRAALSTYFKSAALPYENSVYKTLNCSENNVLNYYK